MQLSHQRYLAASGLVEQPSMPSWIRVSTLHGKPCGKSVLDALDCLLSPCPAKASQSASGGLTWRRPERDQTMETAPTISSSSPGAVNWPAIEARITS